VRISAGREGLEGQREQTRSQCNTRKKRAHRRTEDLDRLLREGSWVEMEGRMAVACTHVRTSTHSHAARLSSPQLPRAPMGACMRVLCARALTPPARTHASTHARAHEFDRVRSHASARMRALERWSCLPQAQIHTHTHPHARARARARARTHTHNHTHAHAHTHTHTSERR
jgi:hypothetical protein